MANAAALQPLVSTEKHQLLFLDEAAAWLPFLSGAPAWLCQRLATPAAGQGHAGTVLWASPLARCAM